MSIKHLIFPLLVCSIGCSDSATNKIFGLGGDSREPVYKYYAYVGAQYGNVVYMYSIDKESGELSELATPSVATQTLPMTTCAGSGKFVFAINYSSHSVSSYSIAPETGMLTLVEHQALTGSASPGGCYVHPTKPILYVANSGTHTVAVLDYDDNGDLTLRGSVNSGGNGTTALAMDSQGSLLYAVDADDSQITIFDVDADGDLQLANTASLPGGSGPNAIAVSPNDNFVYTGNWTTGDVTGFSVSGNQLVSLGASVTSGGGGVFGISISPDGKRLYATKPYSGSGEFAVHSLDPATGAMGVAVEEALPGIVGVSFFEGFAFMIPWASNGSAGLPVQTRSYSESSGVGTAPLFSTATPNKGMYYMTVVKVEVPEVE